MTISHEWKKVYKTTDIPVVTSMLWRGFKFPYMCTYWIAMSRGLSSS